MGWKTSDIYELNKKPIKKLSRVLYGLFSRCQKGSMQHNIDKYISFFTKKQGKMIYCRNSATGWGGKGKTVGSKHVEGPIH
jgi:hypothetical protein